MVPQVRAAHAQRVEPKLVTPSFEEQSTVVSTRKLRYSWSARQRLVFPYISGSSGSLRIDAITASISCRWPSTSGDVAQPAKSKERVYSIFDYGHDLLWFSWTEENLARRFERGYRGFVQVVRWPALGRTDSVTTFLIERLLSVRPDVRNFTI